MQVAGKLVLSNPAPVLEGVTSTAPTSGTSAYKGVSLNRGSNRWEARIRIRGRAGARNVYLGSFVDEIAAARAFDAAVLTLHGDSHPMNFSPDKVCHCLHAELHFQDCSCQIFSAA